MEHSATSPLAVVTGASSGIGYELAKQFAEPTSRGPRASSDAKMHRRMAEPGSAKK